MRTILFYDFEVFSHDWLVVIYDMVNQKKYMFINNADALQEFYEANKHNIWVGFNSNHYDQYILKAIVCGFDPKKVNDYIIKDDNFGYSYSSLFKQVPVISYDVMKELDRGLKWFEGSMGNDIRESAVPFDINRKLTAEELIEVGEYCIHDVEQTIEIFMKRKSEFDGKMGLVRLACEGRVPNLMLLSKTNAQLSAIILNAKKTPNRGDEFDIDFPYNLQVTKYKTVLDWYRNPENKCYSRKIVGKRTNEKTKFETLVANVLHTFAWGGVHGAREKYHGKGYFINMDVASLYPSLMILYNLHSRNIHDPQKFVDIYHKRLELKKAKDPLQGVLKIVLNSTYGVMKDKNNALYDPLQANRVCVYGQLLLLDLIEHLEARCEIIQSNTDGILVKMPDGEDEDTWFDWVDDIAYEWEKRTGLILEFDEYREVYQKDVNNYIIIDGNRKYKSKGAYLKELSDLDQGDFPIVNEALVAYMVSGTKPEATIRECNDLIKFQLVTKISKKYLQIIHGDKEIKEKCIRVFASLDPNDSGVKKISARTKKAEKISNSPESCFIQNDAVNGVNCPTKLDKQWYIDLAYKRLSDFGVKE